MGSFGDRLKKEREQRSISLDDIALSTKIGTRMLRALEEEKFDQLPGGIFNKGFVRAYARHVGLDEEQTVADYMAALGQSQMKATEEASSAKPEPVPERHSPVVRERQESTERAAEIPWGLLALVLLLVALAFASWSYYHRGQRDDSGKTSIPARTESTSTPPVNADSSPARPSAANASQAVTAANPSAPPPAHTVRQPWSQPGVGTQAVQQASESQRLTPLPTRRFTVLLKANEESEESWVSIAIDGKPPVEAILTAPAQKVIQATNEVVIKTGNVGALDFFFNGKRLPPQGDYGIVKTLTFRSGGLQPPPPRPVAPAPR
jgi:cytoskeleton protein RodZ